MEKDLYMNSYKVLMEKWKTKHNAIDNGFAEDGIVSPDIWFALPPEDERILLLLKEAYTVKDPKLVWSEAKWLAHEVCMENCGNDCKACTITGGTFNAVAEWIYGIIHARDGTLNKYDNWLGVQSRKTKEYRTVRDSLLARTAIVNIKKSSGVSNSTHKDIKCYAEHDMDFLVEQIELIKPTVIICGGTYEMLRHIYPQLQELKCNNNGATMLGNVKVIASCHPNAHIKNEDKYHSVVGNYVSLFK